MEFVTDNYMWFLVGGIIIVMTIIGYFAEKTDFGRKDKKEDTTREDRKKAKADKITAEKAAKEETLAAEKAAKEEKQAAVKAANLEAIAKKAEEVAKKKEEAEAKKGVPEVERKPREEDLSVPSEAPKKEEALTTEDITAPIESFETPKNESVTIEALEEDLYAPLGDTEIKPVLEETTEVPGEDTLEVEKKDEFEDDVWKF